MLEGVHGIPRDSKTMEWNGYSTTGSLAKLKSALGLLIIRSVDETIGV